MGDFKLSAKYSAYGLLPLSFVFLWLWNPHGELGSLSLYFIGLFGAAPFLYSLEFFGYQLGALGFLVAVAAQYLWFLFWVYVGRKIWHAARRHSEVSL